MIYLKFKGTIKKSQNNNNNKKNKIKRKTQNKGVEINYRYTIQNRGAISRSNRLGNTMTRNNEIYFIVVRKYTHHKDMSIINYVLSSSTSKSLI